MQSTEGAGRRRNDDYQSGRTVIELSVPRTAPWRERSSTRQRYSGMLPSSLAQASSTCIACSSVSISATTLPSRSSTSSNGMNSAFPERKELTPPFVEFGLDSRIARRENTSGGSLFVRGQSKQRAHGIAGDHKYERQRWYADQVPRPRQRVRGRKGTLRRARATTRLPLSPRRRAKRPGST